MIKYYYNQHIISSSLQNFFKNFSISLPQLKSLSFFITGLISAESIVTADVSRKLKDNFSLIQLESVERRFRRFFNSFSSFAYSFYDAFIEIIISKFMVKHADKKVHISFNHMHCKNKFTILLFSLRIGKQGIPLCFRCFKFSDYSNAFSTDLIKSGISYCANLFSDKNYHVIFLADRWFPNIDILSHIQSLGCFYCIRSKSYFSYSYYNSKGFLVTSYIRNIKPLSLNAKVLKDVFYTRKMFKTTIVVSNYTNTDDVWYLVTNDVPTNAVKHYAYRFGSIESIFKSQKSNGFRLESTNTQKLEHFISLFTIMCIALVWLTIIGVDYVKNKHHYHKHLKIRDVRRHRNNSTTRLYSFFNLGLTIFNKCYYNYVSFVLKFNFVLYDI